MKVQCVVVVGLAVAFAASCAVPETQQPVSIEADAAAIHDLAERWTAAVEAGDVAGVVSVYTEDAVRMPPGAPAYGGTAAIEELFKGLFEQFEVECTWPTEQEEIVVADGWAFHVDNYKLAVTPLAGGETVEQDGKVVVILRKQPDGSWKFAREIWNLNTPATGGE